MNTIIKSTYLLPAAMLLLTACSQEEGIPSVDTGDGNRIIFRASVPDSETRAQVVGKDDIQSFFLTAFNPEDPDNKEGKLTEYFGNQVLTKDDDKGLYYSDNCLWPKKGQEANILTFFAYYPGLFEGSSLDNGSTLTGNKATLVYKIKDISIPTDMADQIDFITASTTGSMADNYFSGINLNFRHQMSRIEVKAKGEHKSCDIEIAGVRLANVPMSGNFQFQTSDADGTWTDLAKGNAEYIFRNGDAIIKVGANPVSILGRQNAGNDNCAMLIPSACTAWDYTKDAGNTSKGIYLNVLLRIIDKTPSGNGKVQYPYFDNSQGLNAMNIDREYFAVVRTTGTVSRRVYKNGNRYYSDKELKQPYTLASGEEIREFGWAALPISADWKPGYTYTYTLDYTSGVGLHSPDVTGDVSPKAGDPIISDRVGVSVSVNDWQGLNGTTTSQIVVPGS